ncbi:hypothetical protein NDU88_006474 [Pleurodeles waltl]|uniref:Uncharacterized protein n=1 Tax=Pleurodeles waltl TaxID=8319 RepID=A0AAV7SPQ5_PLEWA|nr:hypothetical protein NDU88_006474 [Pleurodeles waltl]
MKKCGYSVPDTTCPIETLVSWRHHRYKAAVEGRRLDLEGVPRRKTSVLTHRTARVALVISALPTASSGALQVLLEGPAGSDALLTQVQAGWLSSATQRQRSPRCFSRGCRSLKGTGKSWESVAGGRRRVPVAPLPGERILALPAGPTDHWRVTRIRGTVLSHRPRSRPRYSYRAGSCSGLNRYETAPGGIPAVRTLPVTRQCVFCALYQCASALPF